MTKRKPYRTKSTPKWKEGQVKTRRKTVNSRKRRKPLGFLKIPTISGFARFLFIGVLFALAARYAGLPVARAIASHPVFNVRHVVVEGARYIDREKIIEVAGVELETGIYDTDYNGISQRLKKAFAVEDFTVFKRLPNTVVIEIIERKPVALLNSKTLVGIDEKGVPLPHIGAGMVESLPIISGIRSVKALSDPAVKERLLKGLSMLDRISEDAPSVYSRISEVDVTNISSMGISLVDNGLEVIIGESDWIRKIPALDKIINEVTSREDGVKAVDIRYGEKIFIRK